MTNDINFDFFKTSGTQSQIPSKGLDIWDMLSPSLFSTPIPTEDQNTSPLGETNHHQLFQKENKKNEEEKGKNNNEPKNSIQNNTFDIWKNNSEPKNNEKISQTSAPITDWVFVSPSDNNEKYSNHFSGYGEKKVETSNMKEDDEFPPFQEHGKDDFGENEFPPFEDVNPPKVSESPKQEMKKESNGSYNNGETIDEDEFLPFEETTQENFEEFEINHSPSINYRVGITVEPKEDIKHKNGTSNNLIEIKEKDIYIEPKEKEKKDPMAKIKESELILNNLLVGHRFEEAKQCKVYVDTLKRIQELNMMYDDILKNKKNNLSEGPALSMEMMNLKMQLPMEEIVAKWKIKNENDFSFDDMIQKLSKVPEKLPLFITKFNKNQFVNITLEKIDEGIKLKREAKQYMESLFTDNKEINPAVIVTWIRLLTRCSTELEKGLNYINLIKKECYKFNDVDKAIERVFSEKAIENYCKGLSYIYTVSRRILNSFSNKESEFTSKGISTNAIATLKENITRYWKDIYKNMMTLSMERKLIDLMDNQTGDLKCEVCFSSISKNDNKLNVNNLDYHPECFNLYQHYMK